MLLLRRSRTESLIINCYLSVCYFFFIILFSKYCKIFGDESDHPPYVYFKFMMSGMSGVSSSASVSSSLRVPSKYKSSCAGGWLS